MGQKIKITEEQLKRLVENELNEQPTGRLAAIGNSALGQMNVAPTNTGSTRPTPKPRTYPQTPPTRQTTVGKPTPQTSSKLDKGVYKNTTVEMLSDGSLILDVPNKGVFKYQCYKYSPTIKKIR